MTARVRRSSAPSPTVQARRLAGQGAGVGWLVGGLLLGAVVAFTLVVIMPTNRRLLDPRLDAASEDARQLLRRWGQLHAVRSVVGAGVFVAFVIMSAR